MANKEEQEAFAPDWKDRVKYWMTMAGVIFVLGFLAVMWVYSFIMTTECDFVRFVTFQCERVFR